MGLDLCPKCGLKLPQPQESCPKCGLIFAKYTPERRTAYASDVTVTTTDLHEPYRLIGPIYAGISNRGRALEELAKKFNLAFESTANEDLLRGIAGIEVQVHFQQLPTAFAVCVEQLKRACIKVGGNAVVGLRMDTDIEAAMGAHHFYLQMYGTAVRTQSSAQGAPA